MWVAKIKFNSEGMLIGSKLPNYGVDILGFPLSYHYVNNAVIVQMAANLIGNNQNKKELIEDLRKEKRVIELELNDDFLVATIREPKFAEVFYNKSIIHVKPAIISSNGYAVIEVASYQKEPLSKIVDLAKNQYKGQLLWIKQKKIKSISIMTVRPELTEKQRQAIELAMQKGYYEVPRKTSIQELAKHAGLSFSTFQVHLRKAEKKLLPSLIE
ncbi:MAG: helix-turn-helix domain-containing protein [Candidatus Heimdallarchaeaceae archaeon]